VWCDRKTDPKINDKKIDPINWGKFYLTVL